MTALIDADSIVYIIGYNYREDETFATTVVQKTCDDFVQSILTLTQADEYLGVFSSKQNFRHTVYKYRPYKGTRKEKEDWLIRWEPVIKQHLTEKWGFYTSPDLEADDVIVAIARTTTDPVVICSPDKDLRQVPGYFFDYRTNLGGIQTVTERDALLNFWSQMLTGDSTDNIAGVPGMGPVKVHKLFQELEKTEVLNDLVLMQAVKGKYLDYFDNFYGEQIYAQTLVTVMMMQPTHPLWNAYGEGLQTIKETYARPTPIPETGDEPVLNQLGWTL